jgi:hypothetical protein
MAEPDIDRADAETLFTVLGGGPVRVRFMAAEVPNTDGVGVGAARLLVLCAERAEGAGVPRTVLAG